MVSKSESDKVVSKVILDSYIHIKKRERERFAKKLRVSTVRKLKYDILRGRATD